MHGAHGVPTDHVIRIAVAVSKNVSDIAIDPLPPMAVTVALVTRKQSESAICKPVQVRHNVSATQCIKGFGIPMICFSLFKKKLFTVLISMSKALTLLVLEATVFIWL